MKKAQLWRAAVTYKLEGKKIIHFLTNKKGTYKEAGEAIYKVVHQEAIVKIDSICWVDEILIPEDLDN